MKCVVWRAALLSVLLEAALGFGAAEQISGFSSYAATNAAGQPASSISSSNSGPVDIDSPDSADFNSGDTRLVTIPVGTLMRIEVTRRDRLRLGTEVQAHLIEPIYAENRLVIPCGALLHGTIIETRPAAHSKRLNAKLRGDFTPLREPVIQWTLLSRADGSEYSLWGESETRSHGTLYFRTEAPQHASFARRTWNSVTAANKPVQTDEAPHRGERLQKYLWSQLPLHPQYLEQGARYEVRLKEDLQIEARALPASVDLGQPRPITGTVWVYSRLLTNLDSATAKAGDPVEAIVTAPVSDEQGRLILPQDSILYGTVLSSGPSGPRGHNGNLRFAFHQVSWPGGFSQRVEASPLAIESTPGAKLTIDPEGGVARQNEHSFAAPLLMGLLSGSTFGDEEAGRGKITASSNGFALIGRVAGLASGSPYVGGGLGAVATARSIHKHWLAHGKETTFAPETEVVLEMAPGHANPITMSAQK